MKPKGRRMIGHNASEGIEPRNCSSSHWAKGFMVLEASSVTCVRVSAATPCRGLSPWQVIQRFASELGRAMPLPRGSLQQAEEARRRYGGTAVGPTHSRGVVGVMPGAGSGAHSKGLAVERRGMRKRMPDTELETRRGPN